VVELLRAHIGVYADLLQVFASRGRPSRTLHHGLISNGGAASDLIKSLDLGLLEALEQLFFALCAHLVREVEKGLLLLGVGASSTRGQPFERGDRRRASSSLLSLTSLVACPSSHKRRRCG
jgi:hypothetical protein